MLSPVKAWWRLIRFGFRLLYNELAFTYDWVSKIVSLGAWRCWQRSVFSYIDEGLDAPVLEIAHGTGDMQLDLHERGYKSIGLDLSPQMGRIARRKGIKRGFTPTLLRSKAQSLPFPTAYFPVVLSTFPTPFIFEKQTLNEIYRVLLPNGKLVIVINGGFAGRGAAQQSLELLYRITGQRSSDDEDTQQSQISGRFAECGFTIEFRLEDCPRSYAQVIIAQKIL